MKHIDISWLSSLLGTSNIRAKYSSLFPQIFVNLWTVFILFIKIHFGNTCSSLFLFLIRLATLAFFHGNLLGVACKLILCYHYVFVFSEPSQCFPPWLIEIWESMSQQDSSCLSVLSMLSFADASIRTHCWFICHTEKLSGIISSGIAIFKCSCCFEGL